MMNEEKSGISVSSDDSLIPSDSGTITPLEQEEKITIKRATNHNEISSMESNWEQIKRKVKAISLKRGFDPIPVLVGAAIPYAIDIISDYVDEAAPNYFPFFICVLLMVICKLLSKIVPFLHENDYAINQVHLQDLDHLLKQIDRNQEEKTK